MAVMRLVADSKIVRYYETVGRELTAAIMKWSETIKVFFQHFKALEDRKKENDIPDVPKITKSLAVTKWSESFQDFLSRVLGMKMISLAYIIREDDDVSATALPLANEVFTTPY